jgi:hypothetical protein
LDGCRYRHRYRCRYRYCSMGTKAAGAHALVEPWLLHAEKPSSAEKVVDET